MPRRITLAPDLRLAIAIAIGAVAEVFLLHLDSPAVVAPATLLASLTVSLRRRSPLVPVAAAVALMGVEALAGVPSNLPISPIVIAVVASYSLGSYADLDRAVAGLTFMIALAWAMILLRRHDATDLPFSLFGLGAPWVFGRAMRARVAHSTQLATEVIRVERDSEQRAIAAAADERARIARELHDVIAHSVSVMVVQAGAAEEVLRSSPQRALDPLRAVQQTGRGALAEMARLLGILRRDAQQLGFAPQPGLDDIDGLLAQTQAAGLPVTLSIQGEPRPLALGADLCAYRIIQEALTNTRKHAGAAHAQVTIHYAPDAVQLEVTDDGAGHSDTGGGGGHGLIGMRERVALFEGQLEAGAMQQGGYRVHARLPIGNAS